MPTPPPATSSASAHSLDAHRRAARWYRPCLARPCTRSCIMTVKITPNDKGTPPGKLAEAEIHFEDGYFQGLKLVGFAVWERRSGNGRNVTFPARQYSVNGERRSFALLAPDYRLNGAGSPARSDPAGVSRARRADGGGGIALEMAEVTTTSAICRSGPRQSASRSRRRASAEASTPRGGSCRARCGRTSPSCRRR